MTRRDFRHWTPEEDAKLYELWLAEGSTGAIATRLGRSKTAVLQRVLNLRKIGVGFPYRAGNRSPGMKSGWVTRRNLAR